MIGDVAQQRAEPRPVTVRVDLPAVAPEVVDAPAGSDPVEQFPGEDVPVGPCAQCPADGCPADRPAPPQDRPAVCLVAGRVRRGAHLQQIRRQLRAETPDGARYQEPGRPHLPDMLSPVGAIGIAERGDRPSGRLLGRLLALADLAGRVAGRQPGEVRVGEGMAADLELRAELRDRCGAQPPPRRDLRRLRGNVEGCGEAVVGQDHGEFLVELVAVVPARGHHDSVLSHCRAFLQGCTRTLAGACWSRTL